MKNKSRFVIVRTINAGVFAGMIVEHKDKQVTLKNARRIWYWDGAASLSELAVYGTSRPSKCKFPPPVEQVILTEAIEIIDCTPMSEKSIKEVPVWRA